LVKYFVGEAFREGINIVPILLLANLCLGVFVNLSIWYKLSGQTKYGAYLTIIGAVITLLANIILIPLFGYTGAAWATLICYSSIMIISYLIGQSKFYIPYNLAGMFNYLLLAIVLFFIQNFLLNETESTIKIILNTTMVFGYFAFAFYKEKENFKSKN
jgi:O-antigen/teichoic acid export membrane protein